MPAREAILTADEKRQIAANAFKVDDSVDVGWEDAPSSENGRIVRGVEWELQFGDLDQYRRYAGKYRVVLNPIVFSDGGYDDRASKSLATSIKTRLARVFPHESWSVIAHADGIRLGYVGAKVVRSSSGAVIHLAPAQGNLAGSGETAGETASEPGENDQGQTPYAVAQ
jgi:hypothetical protein